jgi:hypothetical protein
VGERDKKINDRIKNTQKELKVGSKNKTEERKKRKEKKRKEKKIKKDRQTEMLKKRSLANV